MFGRFRKEALPTNDDIDPQRAAEFFQRGDYPEALRRANVMLATGPHIALAWRFKGECLFQMKRYVEAEACFRRAGELGGPGTNEVLFWVAFCQHNAERCEAALTTLQGYLANLPENAVEQRQQAE